MSKIVIKQLIEKVEKNIEFKRSKKEDVSDLWVRVLPYLTVLKIENSLTELKTVLNLKGGLSIDYDFIPEIKVRSQLIKDNQRMENAYFDDVLNEHERFRTFCKLAFFQIELILNTFYRKLYPLDADFVAYLESKNERYKKEKAQEKAPTDFYQIPIVTKLFTFYNDSNFYMKSYGYDLEYLREIRNLEVHPDMISKYIRNNDRYFKSFLENRDYEKVRKTLEKVVETISKNMT